MITTHRPKCKHNKPILKKYVAAAHKAIYPNTVYYQML